MRGLVKPKSPLRFFGSLKIQGSEDSFHFRSNHSTESSQCQAFGLLPLCPACVVPWASSPFHWALGSSGSLPIYLSSSPSSEHCYHTGMSQPNSCHLGSLAPAAPCPDLPVVTVISSETNMEPTGPSDQTGISLIWSPLRCLKVKVKSLSRIRLFETPWTVVYQAPLSMGFSRQ